MSTHIRFHTLYKWKLQVVWPNMLNVLLCTNSRLIRKTRFLLNWWRHLEYYWLIKYVSIVYSCSSIGRTQGCGSHSRFSLWQLFYNTSSWFMGAIYFPFFVHTEESYTQHSVLLFTKYVLFSSLCFAMLLQRISCCYGSVSQSLLTVFIKYVYKNNLFNSN